MNSHPGMLLTGIQSSLWHPPGSRLKTCREDEYLGLNETMSRFAKFKPDATENISEEGWKTQRSRIKQKVWPKGIDLISQTGIQQKKG